MPDTDGLEQSHMYEKSIELLNKGLADELWAVHQYMYFHFHSDDQGYDLLASLFKRTAIQEMVHAEEFAERILFLGGEVEMKPSNDVTKVSEVRAMLEMAMNMEKQAVQDYNAWANECSANNDAASRKIFEELVADEEGHADKFESQMESIDKFGEQFLALQTIERSRSMVTGPIHDHGEE